MLFIFKVKILVLIKWPYSRPPPQMMLITEPKLLVNMSSQHNLP